MWVSTCTFKAFLLKNSFPHTLQVVPSVSSLILFWRSARFVITSFWLLVDSSNPLSFRANDLLVLGSEMNASSIISGLTSIFSGNFSFFVQADPDSCLSLWSSSCWPLEPKGLKSKSSHLSLVSPICSKYLRISCLDLNQWEESKY